MCKGLSVCFLIAALVFGPMQGARAAVCSNMLGVNGGQYCGNKVYVFDAPAFSLLNAQLGPAPNWISSGPAADWLPTFLDNRDIYIGTFVGSDESSAVANILKPLQQHWWRGHFFAEYFSYAKFAADVAAGNIDPAITAVSYDNEPGDSNPNHKDLTYTPLYELQNPVYYSALFSGLAHQHGWTVIFAPSCWDLNVMNPKKYPTTDRAGMFNDCGSEILAKVAPYADILDFQIQGFEHDPMTYANLVNAAAIQVKHANPSVQFIAQLSTGSVMVNNKPYATVQNLIDAGTGVFEHVDGFYAYSTDTDTNANGSVTKMREVLQGLTGLP